MRLQLRFKGDYANEFGAHPKGYSRKWAAFYLIDKGEIIPGEVYQEPDYKDGGIYYNLWLDTDYQGRFKTRKELYSFVLKQLEAK